MAGPEVEVVGVVALNNDLARMGRAGGAIDQAATEAATRVLTPRAATVRASIPKVSGAMAATVRVEAQPFGAALSEGSGIAYAGWVDFGGSRPQSGPRSYLPEGRYLFPAVADLTPAATAAFDDTLGSAISSFGWTNQGTNPGAIHG